MDDNFHIDCEPFENKNEGFGDSPEKETKPEDSFAGTVKDDVGTEQTNKSASAPEGNLDDSNLSNDFVIGKDFFLDSSEADSIVAQEEKNTKAAYKKKQSAGKSCLTSMIWMAAILVVAVGVAALLLFLGSDYLGVSFASDAADEKEIVIERGTSAKEVAEILDKNEIINSELFFRFYAKTAGYDSKFQYGVYYFCKQNSYEDIAEALTKQGAVMDEVTVTIPEGFTVDKIAERLEANGVCTARDFKTAVNEANKDKYSFKFMDTIATQTEGVHYRLEGYLFPDTYKFFKTGTKEGAEQAIRKMLSRFDEMVTEEMMARADELGYSFHDVLTLASIIQLEASKADDADRQKVSAVFWNRLNNWEGNLCKLQSDPTKEYPYNKDRYNTYEATGLAPGAYCSPGIGSIKAALYPDESCTAYYFVTDKEMNFYYSETLKAHNSTIAKLKKEGKWA